MNEEPITDKVRLVILEEQVKGIEESRKENWKILKTMGNIGISIFYGILLGWIFWG